MHLLRHKIKQRWTRSALFVIAKGIMRHSRHFWPVATEPPAATVPHPAHQPSAPLTCAAVKTVTPQHGTKQTRQRPVSSGSHQGSKSRSAAPQRPRSDLSPSPYCGPSAPLCKHSEWSGQGMNQACLLRGVL